MALEGACLVGSARGGVLGFEAHARRIAASRSYTVCARTALNFTRNAFGRNGASLSISPQLHHIVGSPSSSSLGGSRNANRGGRGRGGDFFGGIRAQAEVERERADGRAEKGPAENGRREWNIDTDTGKAQALSDSTIYPIMRVYRNDLCSLEVTGDARAWQVVEAMAADGGFTASEELAKGRSLMTVETIVPGRSGDHSTVSTKLLAPTQSVKKKASTMWARNGGPKKVSLSSGNALARAFQTVTVQRLLAFDLRIRASGTVRDMANLANEKENGVLASLESRDGDVLGGLAEAVCSYALASVKENFLQRMSGKPSYSRLFRFWNRQEGVWALDRAICVCPLSESKVWELTKSMVEEAGSIGRIGTSHLTRNHQSWWPFSAASPGPSIFSKEGMNCWTNEFVPIHKVQIDTRKIRVDAKGWQYTKNEGVLELHLTHAQLVDLADMLDLFYEDGYTVPAKTLRSGGELKISHVSRSKVTNALWTAGLLVIAGGVLLVGLLVTSKLRRASTTDLRANAYASSSFLMSDSSFKSKWCRTQSGRQPLIPSNNEIPAEEIEVLCCQVVNRVKDAFRLAGSIESSPGKGAWLGPDLTQWGRIQSPELMTRQGDSDGDPLIEGRNGETSELASTSEISQKVPRGQEVLLYQVVLSRDGKVLGFQPGNKPAITFWANYPFSQDLHKGQRLRPGLIEPGLRYSELPEQVVAIELICQADSATPSISARPLEL